MPSGNSTRWRIVFQRVSMNWSPNITYKPCRKLREESVLFIIRRRDRSAWYRSSLKHRRGADHVISDSKSAFGSRSELLPKPAPGSHFAAVHFLHRLSSVLVATSLSTCRLMAASDADGFK